MNYYSSVGKKFRVYCQDGVTRTAVTTAEPDTYFSQPASVQVKGKRISGYITTCYTHKYHFGVYTYGKNSQVMKDIGTNHHEHGECDT